MLSILLGLSMLKANVLPPKLPREFRGVWVATVDNIDWPSKPGLPIEKQKEELGHLIRKFAQLHFNAIIFQVRPHCDAVYKSRLEPSSWYITGEQGKGLGWDPLAYAITECHKFGLELHAWFNPFRAGHPAQKGSYCQESILNAHPDWIVSYNKYKWLDPGIDQCRQHSLDVILDVVKNYDIDGVHIDDYFYPYKENGLEFDDSRSFGAFIRGGGSLSRSEWRRRNISDFVTCLASKIKSIKSTVKFGISPFGIYRPNVPEGIKAGVDQYEELGADVLAWWRDGVCDYLSPQLYWKVTSTGQPFEKLLDWWSSENSKSRALWPGIYTSQLLKTWQPSEILSQVQISRKLQSMSGVVHFSATSLLSDVKGISATLSQETYKGLAAIPEMSWLPPGRMKQPKVEGQTTNGLTLKSDPQAKFYCLWIKKSDAWMLSQISAIPSFNADLKNAESVAVQLIDRSGREGVPRLIDPQEGNSSKK